MSVASMMILSMCLDFLARIMVSFSRIMVTRVDTDLCRWYS
jgi:hypothetical protein